MTKTAALYIRQSQTHDDTISPELQEKNVRRFIEAQGWIAGNTYSDIDISGRKMDNRPGLLALVEAYAAKEFDVAVADDYSRFSRDMTDGSSIIGNMQLATASEGVPDPEDDFPPLLYMLLAHKYSRDMGKRWRNALMHRLAKGLPPSGKPQFGYDKVNGSYVQNADAATLKEAYERYTAGEGVRSICTDFSARGLAAPGPRGWYSGGMFDLLDKVFYAGKIAWSPKKGEEPLVVDGAHEAVLSAGEWAAYRKAREDRKMNLRPKNPKWMLSGLVECGLCGGKMLSHSDSRGKRQLMCGTYNAHGKAACSGVFRRQSIVAMKVWLWLGSHLEEWASISPTDEEAQKAAEKAVLEAQTELERATEDYSGYADWAYENKILASVSAAKMAEKAQSIKDAEQAVESAQAALATLVPATDVHERISAGAKLMGFSEDPEEEPSEEAVARFREALSRVIERVVVHPASTSSPRDPNRDHYSEIEIITK
jgi:site-specific DNA recombinase